MLRSILKPGWAPLGVVGIVMGLWGVPFSVPAKNLAAKIDSLRAVPSDTTQKLGDRVLTLTRAIRMYRTGLSHFELAQLYLAEGDEDDQMDAEFWLKAAIARDRKNSEFRAIYAKLLWQLDDIKTANVQAKKALEIDPNQTCALYYAGRYAAWGMDRNYRTISMGYSSEVEIPFSLRSFGEERLDQAVDHLTRALRVDPGHEQARELLGLVYYEAEEYDEMIALFKERLETVQDADSHFFLGLGTRERVI